MKRTPEEIKEFCLSNIAPYFKDPTICGYNKATGKIKGKCVYLTKDGKMCVLGKNLLNPPLNGSEDAAMIFDGNKQEDVLKPEAIGMLNAIQWGLLQSIHDNIATQQNETIIRAGCEALGIFTYHELVEYTSKLP